MKYALKILTGFSFKINCKFLGCFEKYFKPYFFEITVKFFFEMPNGLEDVGNISLIQRRF
jgi:hypothetical protein